MYKLTAKLKEQLEKDKSLDQVILDDLKVLGYE